jgi:adenylosuccinate synthase
MAIRFNGQGVVVVGGQWGDEGKGRIVDSLAHDCDVIVRFQGGNNAGHSLHIGDQSIVLHLIPCGIMREGKVCVIGNGVVIDPEVLFKEIETLSAHKVFCNPKNLKIAKNTHIILPFHKLVDAARENRSESHIGTTKRGIGPCYEDKIARFGIMAKDLLSEDLLRAKLKNAMDNRTLYQHTAFEELLFTAREYGKKLAPFLCDAGEIIQSYLIDKKRVLFEGAQGTLLDVDHGTYPYVTSSNCVAAQASIGSGVGANWLSDVYMVSKAYATRVGEGPFFTEADPSDQERFRQKGNEFGATTGRPRRCGWLDIPALKYAVRLNGARGLILTKIDVLAGLGPIKIGMSYVSNDKKDLSFLDALHLEQTGHKVTINYIELPKVDSMPEVVNHISEMPSSFRQLCSIIEKEISIPIVMVSYGPKRGQEFFCHN